MKSVEYISEYHSVRKRLIFGDKDDQHAIIKQKLLSWKHALNQAEKKLTTPEIHNLSTNIIMKIGLTFHYNKFV